MTVQLTGTSAGAIDDGRVLLVSFLKVVVYVAAIAAVLLATSLLVLAWLSPQYRAQTTIVIDSTGVESRAPATLGDDLISAQLQLLASQELARAVTQNLDVGQRTALISVAENESWVPKLLSGLGLRRDSAGISLEERLLDAFAEGLSLNAANAPKISIAFATESPQLAADVANAVVDEYRELQRAAQRRDDLRLAEGLSARQRIFLDAPVDRNAARQKGGSPPVAVAVLSRAVAPTEPVYSYREPIAWAVAGLLLLVTVVLIGGRQLAQRRQKRLAEYFDLPEIVEALPNAGQAHLGENRRGRKTMSVAQTIAEIGGGEGIGASIPLLARSLINDRAQRIMVTTVGESREIRPLAAIVLARELARADRRSVLIELRDDATDGQAMGEGSGMPGFSDLFEGDVSFGQAIFRDCNSRAHFIPAGTRPLSRQELGNERFGSLVQALDHTYDHVVLDAACDVVEVVSRACDTAIIVTEFDRHDPRLASTIEDIAASSQAKFLLLGPDGAISEDVVSAKLVV